jgi:hypothetical protein
MLVSQAIPALLLSGFSVVVQAGGGRPDADALNFLKDAKRTTGGVHVPIYRRGIPVSTRKRGYLSSKIGLGDVQDV